MSDLHVVAWDSQGPIEVEMIVGSAGKTYPIKGDMVIHDVETKTGADSLQDAPEATIQNKPLRFFGGHRWHT